MGGGSEEVEIGQCQFRISRPAPSFTFLRCLRVFQTIIWLLSLPWFEISSLLNANFVSFASLNLNFQLLVLWRFLLSIQHEFMNLLLLVDFCFFRVSYNFIFLFLIILYYQHGWDETTIPLRFQTFEKISCYSSFSKFHSLSIQSSD